MATTTAGNKPQYNYKKIWWAAEQYRRICRAYENDTLVFQIYPYFFAFGRDARMIINASRSEDQPLLADTPPLSEPLILDAADLTRQMGLMEEAFSPIKILGVPAFRN